MAAKSANVPRRPPPQLYLATPLIGDPAEIVGLLPSLLDGAPVAAVLARLSAGDERGTTERAKKLARSVQAANVAFLLDGHVELVARAGADGAHVSGIAAMNEALPTLKPDRIAGVGGLTTRHDAMTAGEAGADYVLFGETDADGLRASTGAIADRLQWWAELFEPPCVGFANSCDEASVFAAAGADFVLVSDLVWSDPRGPRAALMDAANAIGQNPDGSFGRLLRGERRDALAPHEEAEGFRTR